MVTNITLYGNLTSCNLAIEEKFPKNLLINKDELDNLVKNQEVYFQYLYIIPYDYFYILIYGFYSSVLQIYKFCVIIENYVTCRST